ncbi:hypothetical protein A6P39_026505 [Streptomyces sp. FXJ1.172]|nr:hypothetical protein [Streptomyces sp. FXJ1.172]WEO97280.1 hypothetical protein A6P39_026505 [Streptomyces sp. FXJ1.172]
MDQKKDVPLAVLSATTHGSGPLGPAILESLAAALRTIDPDSAAVFVQFVDSCLADPQAKQGRAEAKAEMVLQILEWRKLPVPDAVRERVQSCTDLGRLEAWAQRAMHATDAAELFTEA